METLYAAPFRSSVCITIKLSPTKLLPTLVRHRREPATQLHKVRLAQGVTPTSPFQVFSLPLSPSTCLCGASTDDLYLRFSGTMILVKAFVVDHLFAVYPRLAAKYDVLTRAWSQLPVRPVSYTKPNPKATRRS